MSEEIKTTFVRSGQHRKRWNATTHPIVVQEKAFVDYLFAGQEWYLPFLNGAVLEYGSFVNKIQWFCENHGLVIETGAKVLEAKVAGDVIAREGSSIKSLLVCDNNLVDEAYPWATRVDGIVADIHVEKGGLLTLGKHARVNRLFAEQGAIVTIERGCGVEHFVHPIRFKYNMVDRLPALTFIQ